MYLNILSDDNRIADGVFQKFINLPPDIKLIDANVEARAPAHPNPTSQNTPNPQDQHQQDLLAMDQEVLALTLISKVTEPHYLIMKTPKKPFS